MYLLPVVGVTVAWIVLGDKPYARHLVGGALILSAVWISERAASAGAVAVPGTKRDIATSRRGQG